MVYCILLGVQQRGCNWDLFCWWLEVELLLDEAAGV
jgi:hypothetical protein